MAHLRNQLHALGYALNYTPGVMRKASIYPWRKVENPQQFEVNMSDPVVGWRKIESIIESLKK